jgi:hypothetical protein
MSFYSSMRASKYLPKNNSFIYTETTQNVRPRLQVLLSEIRVYDLQIDASTYQLLFIVLLRLHLLSFRAISLLTPSVNLNFLSIYAVVPTGSSWHDISHASRSFRSCFIRDTTLFYFAPLVIAHIVTHVQSSAAN